MPRIAAIEFLNAAPLMWGLEHDARFTLRHTLPSACADALRDGEADLGVIPAIELVRGSDLVALGGMGVASRDAAGEAAEVRSILLICRCPPAQVRRVALDRASRTSAALAQILLLRHFGAAAVEAVAGDRHWREALDAGADAVLVIGDPALQANVRNETAGFAAYDLARVWREWTGLPFVFALWAVRREVFAAEEAWLPRRLEQALAEGLEHREDLVQLWAPRLGLPSADVRRYLEANVAYRLTAAHRAGLDRFFALAAAQGLVASSRLEVKA